MLEITTLWQGRTHEDPTVKGSGVSFQAPGPQRGLLTSSSPQFPLGTEGDTPHHVVSILVWSVSPAAPGH